MPNPSPDPKPLYPTGLTAEEVGPQGDPKTYLVGPGSNASDAEAYSQYKAILTSKIEEKKNDMAMLSQGSPCAWFLGHHQKVTGTFKTFAPFYAPPETGVYTLEAFSSGPVHFIPVTKVLDPDPFYAEVPDGPHRSPKSVRAALAAGVREKASADLGRPLDDRDRVFVEVGPVDWKADDDKVVFSADLRVHVVPSVEADDDGLFRPTVTPSV